MSSTLRFQRLLLILCLSIGVSTSFAQTIEEYHGQTVQVGHKIQLGGTQFKLLKKDLFSSRPDVEEVSPLKARAIDIDGIKWMKYEDAYLVLLSFLEAAYPEGEFYFLARDIESLYDLARIIHADDPERQERFRLIPIGRGIVDGDRLKSYLNQQGLTKAKLKGRTPVFVDSCCSGSIPSRLIGEMDAKGIPAFGFLISADQYPHSKLFAHISGGSGGDIESHPHFTGAAISILDVNDKLEVLMESSSAADDANPNQALKILRSIRTFGESTAARERHKNLKERFEILVQFLTGQGSVKKSIDPARRAFVELVGMYGLPLLALKNDLQNLSRNNQAEIDSERTKLLFAPGEDDDFDNTISSLRYGLAFLEATTENRYQSFRSLFSYLTSVGFEGLDFQGEASSLAQKKKIYAELLDQFLEIGDGLLKPDQMQELGLEQIRQLYLFGKFEGVKFNSTRLLRKLPLGQDFTEDFIEISVLDENCAFFEGSTLWDLLGSALVGSEQFEASLKTCLKEFDAKTTKAVLNRFVTVSLGQYQTPATIPNMRTTLRMLLRTQKTVGPGVLKSILSHTNVNEAWKHGSIITEVLASKDLWTGSAPTLVVDATTALLHVLEIYNLKPGPYSLAQLAKAAPGCAKLLVQ